jgi:anthranilate/para-aminobenzoate synthase component I
MFALETGLPPQPLALAERLWGEEGAVFLWSADGAGPSFISCWPTEERSALDPEPELGWPSADFADERTRAPRWVGILPYEAARARMERPKYRREELREAPHHNAPRWWRYGAFVCVGQRVSVVGDDPVAVRALYQRLHAQGTALRPTLSAERLGPARLWRLPEQEPTALHRARVQRALELIREGEIYQVNLARRIVLAVEGDTLGVLKHMAARAPAAFCFASEAAQVVSTSPELCLQTTAQRRALTLPIKGTRPRGADAQEDLDNIEQLARDAKEHAELAMVVDIERNDLGRVANIGSVVVRSPSIVQHRTLFHRQAMVSARIRDEVTRDALLLSMLPSGSVTGAPKVRAMELIAELETERRGLYTGAFGMLRHDGTLNLAMAIRTLTLNAQRGHYFVGGGIVLGSDAEREVQETEWKAVQLANA